MIRTTILGLWIVVFVFSMAAPSTIAAQSDFTCADFNTQEVAQAILDANLGAEVERALDPDGDGLACEDLPSSGTGNAPTPKPGATATPDEAADSREELRLLDGRFGGSRKTFEEEYGEPVDSGQGNYPIGDFYEVPGFDSVNVFYHKDYAAYITLKAALDTPWSKIKANQLVRGFLPADVELDRATTTEGGDALTTGHSEALEKRYHPNTYERYGAQGEVGDLYFLLRLDDDARVEAIEIALGHVLQTPQVGLPEETPTSTGGGTTQAELDYLAQIGSEFDALQTSLDQFDQILDGYGAGTITAEDAVSQLVAIFNIWVTADQTAQAITPPSTLQETHALYLEFTGLLAGAAADYGTGLNQGDDALLAAGDEKLGQARALAAILDALLSPAE